MINQPLAFSHPIEHLYLHELNPGKWSEENPPDLFLMDESFQKPPALYMPPIKRMEVEREDGWQVLEDGRCKRIFKLTEKVNDLWSRCFEPYRNGFEVSFEGDKLILICKSGDLEKTCEEICHRDIHLATRDYRKEREALLWQVFLRMIEIERCENVKAEIRAQIHHYIQKRRERELFAQERGWSLPFFVQNLNQEYREILENKFTWWGKILDETTIRQHKALFEQAMLVL